MLPTSTLGKKYENMALHYLKIEKYKILARNFSCPAGELDIIAYDKDNDYIVFVEVKYRSTNAFGRPIEAITPEKARKINRFLGFETVVMGLLMIVSIFFPPVASVVCLVLLIPYVIIGVVYGILVGRK